MATIEKLIASGQLVRLDSADRSPPHRILVALPDFIRWLGEVLPDLESERDRRTPQEQVEGLFADFIAGERLEWDREFKRLYPHGEQVWELKTNDVRVFGWFFKKDHFVASRGALKGQVRRYDLYTPYIAKVASDRSSLALDDQKYVVGTEYADVLSDKD